MPTKTPNKRVNGGGGEPVSKKPVLGYSADFVEEKSSLGYLTQSSKLSGNEPAVAKLCAPQNHWSKLKQAVKSANVVKPKALGAVAKTASFTHALSKKDDTGFEREAEQVALRLQKQQIHEAQIKVVFHLILLAILFIAVRWSRFQIFLRNHVLTCVAVLVADEDADGAAADAVSQAAETIARAAAQQICRDMDGDGIEECIKKEDANDEDFASSVQSHACYLMSFYTTVVLAAGGFFFLLGCFQAYAPYTNYYVKMCKESFQFFAKGREELEEAALYSTVLHLYDQINCRIPRHVSPPTHEEVKKLLEIFDDNGDGVMDEDEFIDFSVFLFNQVVNDVTLVLCCDMLLAPLYAVLLHDTIEKFTGFAVPTVLFASTCIRLMRVSIHENSRMQPSKAKYPGQKSSGKPG